jgi:hypothetical protein
MLLHTPLTLHSPKTTLRLGFHRLFFHIFKMGRRGGRGLTPLRK